MNSTHCSHEISPANEKTLIDLLFSDNWQAESFLKMPALQAMQQATYPQLATMQEIRFRTEWCNGYMNTILQRDVRILLEVEKIIKLPDMLKFIAANTGGVLNEASLARDCGLNHLTAKRYRLLLESLFLVQSVPAWSNNLGKRLIKSPKLYINDINLLAYLLKYELADLAKKDPILFGRVLENFVAIELLKQLSYSNQMASLYHYRTVNGQEIDFILEGPGQQIVAVEVKSKSKLTAKDFSVMSGLQQNLGNRFKRGIVLYQGKDVLPFGPELWAVPFE